MLLNSLLDSAHPDSKTKTGSKRVFLITAEDNPHSDDPVFHRAAQTKAIDLYDNGISINLFVWDTPEKPFDFSHFYKPILDIEQEEDVDYASTYNAASKLDEFKNIIRQKEIKKRSLFRVMFTINEGFEIAVRGYNFVSEQKKPLATNLHRRTNAEVKTNTSYVSKVCVSNTSTLLAEYLDLKRQDYGRRYEVLLRIRWREDSVHFGGDCKDQDVRRPWYCQYLVLLRRNIKCIQASS